MTNLKRKVVALVLLLCFCVSFVACAECIKTEQETVEVVITDANYSSSYTTFVYTGKTMIPIHHAAEYRVTVEYDGIEYVIHGSDIYDTFKDRIGDTAVATFEIRTYDDGRINREIVGLSDGRIM